MRAHQSKNRKRETNALRGRTREQGIAVSSLPLCVPALLLTLNRRRTVKSLATLKVRVSKTKNSMANDGWVSLSYRGVPRHPASRNVFHLRSKKKRNTADVKRMLFAEGEHDKQRPSSNEVCGVLAKTETVARHLRASCSQNGRVCCGLSRLKPPSSFHCVFGVPAAFVRFELTAFTRRSAATAFGDPMPRTLRSLRALSLRVFNLS